MKSLTPREPYTTAIHHPVPIDALTLSLTTFFPGLVGKLAAGGGGGGPPMPGGGGGGGGAAILDIE